MGEDEPRVIKLEPEEIFKALVFLLVTNGETAVEAAVFFDGQIYKIKALLEEVSE